MSSPEDNEFILAPEIEALGLGEHMKELHGTEPTRWEGMVAFRQGLIDGHAERTRPDAAIPTKPRDPKISEAVAAEPEKYAIGKRADALLEQKRTAV